MFCHASFLARVTPCGSWHLSPRITECSGSVPAAFNRTRIKTEDHGVARQPAGKSFKMYHPQPAPNPGPTINIIINEPGSTSSVLELLCRAVAKKMPGSLHVNDFLPTWATEILTEDNRRRKSKGMASAAVATTGWRYTWYCI